MILRLKKPITVLLLLCLAAPVFFFAGFILKQHIIRSSMKQQLKQQLLQTVTVAKNSLVWFDDGKEVSINGNMFDVVSVKTDGNNITLTGLYDTDEDKLHESLHRAMQQKNGQQPINTLLLKMVSLRAEVINASLVINLHWKYITSVHGFSFQKIPSAPSLPLLNPPQA